jgi:hypothetical protein
MALPNLTDQFVADTFKGVLHTANVPINDENVPPVYDGLGNKSALRLGATKVITGKEIQLDDFTFSYEILINLIFPIGSIFLSYDDNNPKNRFIGTDWVKQSEGRFIVGVGTGSDGFNSRTFQTGNNNGEYRHTLTIAEMPSHRHNVLGRKDNYGRTNSADKDTTGSNLNNVVGITDTVGGNASHENTPPGYGVYVWRRIT